MLFYRNSHLDAVFNSHSLICRPLYFCTLNAMQYISDTNDGDEAGMSAAFYLSPYTVD